MKVTLEQIESKIKGETYLVLPDGRSTLCILSLENGYTIKGVSACVDPKEFDLELGRKYARQEAVAQIWPLEGYLLAEKMYNNFVEPTFADIANLAQKEFNKELRALADDPMVFEYKKPHWTQTAKGKKILAARKRRSKK